MSEPRTIAPWVKPALELGPVLFFFVIFLFMRGKTVQLGGVEYEGFILATIAFIPALVLATAVLWKLTGKLSVMQIMTLVLVVVFGGLTAWLNDPRFFAMKPTILYLLFAAILGAGLALRRNWLSLVFSDAFPMRPEGWRILTLRLIMLFIGMAAANELVRLNLSQATWVYFKTFGIIIIMFVFFMANTKLFERYALSRDEQDDASR